MAHRFIRKRPVQHFGVWRRREREEGRDDVRVLFNHWKITMIKGSRKSIYVNVDKKIHYAVLIGKDDKGKTMNQMGRWMIGHNFQKQ